MRVQMSLVSLLLAGSFLQTTARAEEPTVFGNAHMGIAYSNTAYSGDSISIPTLNFGGKAAIEALDNPFGFQADLDANYTSLQWITPNIPAEGSITNIIMVGHGTYAVNDSLKLGLFGGYENMTFGLNRITDPTFDFLSNTGLSKASAGLNVARSGMEALYSWDGQNSMQVRAGVVVPATITASVTTTANVTSAATAAIDDTYGVQLGLGIRNDVTQNISMRADANLVAFGNLGFMNTVVTGQYLFDGMPLAASASVGYQGVYTDSDSAGGFSARTGLSWSFGGVTKTVRGKLFHSSSVLGNFN
jgi:hypothetical protein